MTYQPHQSEDATPTDDEINAWAIANGHVDLGGDTSGSGLVATVRHFILAERRDSEEAYQEALSAFREYTGQAVLAERERCAKVCEAKGPELICWWGEGQANAAAMECAAAIRGQQP